MSNFHKESQKYLWCYTPKESETVHGNFKSDTESYTNEFVFRHSR